MRLFLATSIGKQRVRTMGNCYDDLGYSCSKREHSTEDSMIVCTSAQERG